MPKRQLETTSAVKRLRVSLAHPFSSPQHSDGNRRRRIRPQWHAEMPTSAGRSLEETERVITVNCMVTAFAIAALAVFLIYALV